MALKIQYKPHDFADLFGADLTAPATLTKWGCSVIVEKKVWSLVGPNGETIVGNVPMKEGVVALAKKGELPDAAKSVVSTLVSKAMTSALVWNKWTKADPSKSATTDTVTIESVFTDKPKSKPMTLADLDEEAVPGYGIFEPEIFKPEGGITDVSLQPVPLAEAVSMYQAVQGTSSSSRYFAVGFTEEGINFAARYNDSNLSVRAEGDVKKFKTELVNAGFSSDYIDSKGTYTSVHFHGIDAVMAARALGAVLSGTGLLFKSAMPKLDYFDGKGA